MTTAEAPPRLCPICGAPLVRREGEELAQFTRRKTCSTRCGRRLGARTADERLQEWRRQQRALRERRR